MWTTQFWYDAGERALKTAVQVFVAAYGAASLAPTEMFNPISLKETLLLAGASALLSIGTSILSTGVGNGESASLVGAKPQG